VVAGQFRLPDGVRSLEFRQREEEGAQLPATFMRLSRMEPTVLAP